MGAYRKLLLHNEVTSGRDANCLNDITKILEVSSSSNNTSLPECPIELEMLSNYDFENGIDDTYIQVTNEDSDILRQNSTAYLASIVEQKVIKKIVQKGRKGCMECTQVFVENEISNDRFIQFKEENSQMVAPCKSTVELISTVENLLKVYQTHNVTFNSMLAHIIKKIDVTKFYEGSTFGKDHDHKIDLIKDIVKTYMNVKSTKLCKFITRMKQNKQIRHSYLKAIHLEGQ